MVQKLQVCASELQDSVRALDIDVLYYHGAAGLTLNSF